MAINPLQLPQGPVINSLADWSPLERLVQNWQAQQKEAAQNEQAYRDVGGGQGQQTQGGFLSDLGRKFGILPEAAPVQTAAVPPATSSSPSYGTYAERGAGIGTMTPNARSWHDFAVRPVADGGLGLTEAQAAGKVANLQAESGAAITPWGPTGDQGTAQGSAQWRGDRLRNLVEFSNANGMDYRTTEAQQAFMRHEYLGDPSKGAGGGSERKAYSALTATNSPGQAAAAVDQYYERSSGEHRGRRVAGAERLARGLNGAPVVAQGGNPNAAPAPSAWAARPPLSAAMVDPNASPLDNAPWPQGNVGAPQAVAQGGDPNAPPGTVPPLQERAVPAAPVVASDAPEVRAVQNLTSGQPAAAAGLNRETLARLASNPVTRNLAFAVLQKQMDPGSYTYEKIGDRLMALHNKDPRLNKEVARGPMVVGGSLVTADSSQPGGYAFQTPPKAPEVIHQKEDEIVRVPIPGRPGEYTTFGGEGVGKIQREIDTRTQAALAKGYPQETADYYGMNGKLPKEDLTAKEVGTLTDNQKMINSGKMVLDNVSEMKRLSPEAWSGTGATERAALVSKLLPGFAIPKGATNTEVLSNLALQNVAGQAKAMFGARLAFGEVKLLERLETTPNMSRATREAIYPQIERIINRHNDIIEAENEAIRNKTYKKPGGGPTHGAPSGTAPATAPEPSPAAAATAKPSLNDFMIKARAANPGVSEGELARFWKQKYGG